MGDMRSLEEQRQSYAEKTAYLLDTYGDDVSPYDFYRTLYPEGWLQERGTFRDGKCTAIANALHNRHSGTGTYRKNHFIFDDLAEISKVKDLEVFLAPCSFIGGKKDLAHLRYLNAFTIDLDYVDIPQMKNLIKQIDIGHIPRPTYLVNSGTGLHLYYVFTNPVRVYPDTKYKLGLKTLKFALIEQAWTEYTSQAGEDKQHQGISQQYRIIGSRCKAALGEDYKVLAWKVGGTWTIDQLLNFHSSLNAGKYRDYADKAYPLIYHSEVEKADPNHVTLEQAEQKYPEWYQSRIVNGDKPTPIAERGKWHINRHVYDWWLRRITKETRVGHRYHCVFCLAVYAIKCDIPKEEFERDALSLYEHFESLTDDETNHFDIDKDLKPAMATYNNKTYATLPIESIEYFSGLAIKRNKRNGRTQEDHLAEARMLRDFRRERNNLPAWNTNGGRPAGSGTKRERVAAWRQAHPEGRKADCVRDTGISKPTVLKWWEGIE